jgi:CRISPR-associated protein Cmr3
MAQVIFDPLDTLFFRDGRPFNKGEGTAVIIKSRFPPSPQTLVGSVRASWARMLGWSGHYKWSNEIEAKLGGNGLKLDGLSFYGPILLKNREPVFPVPAMTLGKISDQQNKPMAIQRLRPSERTFCCDFGQEIHLPVPSIDDDVQGRKQLQGWWLNCAGFQKILVGSNPGVTDFISQDSLWQYETRTGIERNKETGTTQEGALFTTEHVRLADDVQLCLGVARSPADMPKGSAMRMALGGEARSADVTLFDSTPDMPMVPDFQPHNGRIRYAVIFLSPFLSGGKPMPNQHFEPFPGKLVSACLYKPEQWGGWNSVERKPEPLQPHVTPGSVLFMEAGAEDLENILSLHCVTAGRKRTWGFGLVAIGRW